MSSAILYVAIVAIWIGVLVPRWLKHENTHSGSAGLRRLSRHFGAGRPDDEEAPRAGFDPEGRPRYTSFVPPETPAEGAPEAPAHPPVHYSESQSDHGEKVSSVASGNKESMAEPYEAAAPRSAVQSYGWSADEAARQERSTKSTTGAGPRPSASPAPAAEGESSEASEWASEDGPGAYDQARASVRVPQPRAPLDPVEDPERRAQIVRGRRRMLWLLLVLTAVGIGLAYLQLAAWWVMVPPTVLLVGYLLLLREAAHADAEARERRGAAQAPARPASGAAPARSAPAPAPAAASATGPAEGPLTVEETGPRAEVIDLSEHVGDQLYDQYADAKLRAVGD